MVALHFKVATIKIDHVLKLSVSPDLENILNLEKNLENVIA